jgi:hypothetical protein
MEQKIRPIEQFDYISTDNIYKQIRSYAYYIGKYFIKFSELEHEINLGISSIVFDDSDEEGYRLIKYLSTANKIEFLCNSYKSRCFHYQFSDQKDRNAAKKLIEKIEGELRKEKTFRNIVGHANWISLTRNNYVRIKIIEREDRVVIKSVKVTPTILKDHIKKIDYILNDLFDIQERFSL